MQYNAATFAQYTGLTIPSIDWDNFFLQIADYPLKWELKRFLDTILIRFSPAYIVFFGSFATFTYKNTSDVDIIILYDDPKPSKRFFMEKKMDMEKLPEYSSQFHIFPYDLLFFRAQIQKKDSFLSIAIEQGALLLLPDKIE